MNETIPFLSPEKIHAAMPEFLHMVSGFYAGDIAQKPDGSGFIDEGLNLMWEGYMQALMMEDYKRTLADKVVEAHTRDGLMQVIRQMRSFSKCFTGAYDHKEPVFVLRAQDNTAHLALAQWIKSNLDRMTESHPKIIAAKQTLANFMNWPNRKDPD